MTKVCENIYWVGYVDWTVRDFHSYDTERGATYNAYVIRDEQCALIDAVKAPYVGHLLHNIREHVGLDQIHYVVCNHAEPDHSSGIPGVLEALPQAQLVCNQKTFDILSAYHNTENWKVQIVKTGDSLCLGQHELQFLQTPMVHWPDSMFTYVPQHKLLFSMDAFGQHYATSQRFDDEVPLCTLMEEAKAYYANIIMPLGRSVAKVLEQAGQFEINIIAPAHGLIWRKHIPLILKAYQEWTVCQPKPKVLVIFDTMWDSTARMAQAIMEGASRPEVEGKLIHIRRSNLTRIATEILDTATLAFGSATINGTMMPMAGAVLTYLKGLRPAGKSCVAFGSTGWAQQGGAEAVQAIMREIGWEVLREPVKARWQPTPEVLETCYQTGAMLAEHALRVAGTDNTNKRICENP